ncbi:hypothetical protein CBR_g10839 [Chara braunii]|uniref:GIY-YIG domain-containing protein n=1 Tax=Chara braunii TaxID=69332 RepID=A0A388KPN4_CHABU|nr:hypothetical protein CBR_g10839 [Chara braunii]|eukprot:GBG71903.1 hypothetical protein CBR_g10839 [Chara braunii]
MVKGVGRVILGAGAGLFGLSVAVSFATRVTMKVASVIVDAKRRERGNICPMCLGVRQVPCRLCSEKGTIEWSPLVDPVAMKPCVCPTCDGSRSQKCLNCLGKGYEPGADGRWLEGWFGLDLVVSALALSIALHDLSRAPHATDDNVHLLLLLQFLSVVLVCRAAVHDSHEYAVSNALHRSRNLLGDVPGVGGGCDDIEEKYEVSRCTVSACTEETGVCLHRRARKEQETRELEERKAEEARLEKERKRLERLEERKRYEDERDTRLLRLVRMEWGSSAKQETEKSEKNKVRVNERGETTEEEKERLRREIALQHSSEEEEDTKLILLRRRATWININDKRRRDPEGKMACTMPQTTPTKGPRTGFMADARGIRPTLGPEAKSRIEEIKSCEGGKSTSASAILSPVGKLSLSMKHVTAGCGPGEREKFEAECRDLFEALTVEELKEVCKNEKIGFVKRDIAIKRLITRRLLKAYDPINVPLPDTMKDAPIVPRAARSARPKLINESADEGSDYDEEDEDLDLRSRNGCNDEITEKCLRAMVIGLTLSGEIPWCEKFLEYWRDACSTDNLDLRRPGGCVYALVSPWYKQTYIGMTERTLNRRWKEHATRGTRKKKNGDRGRQNLYTWLRKVGVEQYVAIPLLPNADRLKLEAAERSMIKTWSPSLNTMMKKRRTKKRRRRGKKEQHRNNRMTEEVTPALNGMAHPEKSTRTKILTLKDEDSTEGTVRIVSLLRKLAKKGKGREYKLTSNGGVVWTDNWRVVRRIFGETRVRVGKRTRPLRKCKQLFEQEGVVKIRDVTKASPSTLRLKNDFVRMFKYKKRQKKLGGLRIEELIRYYAAAKVFSTKRSRSRAKKMVSDVVKRKFGIQISRRVITKARFDDRVKKGEVVRLMKKKIGGLPLDASMIGMVKQRSRVVWTRGPNIGDFIHNHRRYAASGVARCNCTGASLPKVEGHVHFRLGAWEECPTIARNAKNIPRDWSTECEKRLKNEILSSLHGIDWLNVDVSSVSISDDEVCKCVDSSEKMGVGNMESVAELKKRLDGFVCTPLDRNPGETLVMCAEVYATGMGGTFIRNEGYEIRKEEEGDIIARMEDEYKKHGFARFGSWKKGGKLGRAYALPKHKDTSKYRPICPTFSEPGNQLCRRISRGLNEMLFNLPESGHFNLRSVHLMTTKLTKMNRRLERGCANTGVMAASYDIKDMFSKLPHETIVRAVEWCIWWYESKGFRGVFVKARGKGAKLSKSQDVDGFKFVNFSVLLEYVKYDLGNCFTIASGIILRQTVGIPMGKASRPPLACLMCAKSEWDFLLTVGNQRKLVEGIRFVDDSSVFVAYNKKSVASVERAKKILLAYESCYDANLTLKRTDDEEMEWDFLGCRLTISNEFPYLSCHQVMKNEIDLLTGCDLTFQTFQDYESWTGKKAKMAAVTSCLHRIRQNSISSLGMVGAVIALRMELRRRNYPEELFRQVIKNSARDKERIWKMIAELMSV